MAQLRRSKLDNHLYILAGQRLGTWQIDDAGVFWLQKKRYPIPEPGESVPIEAGTFQRLKAKGHLDTLHLNFEKDDPLAEADDDEPVPAGLPFLLKLLEQPNPTWELAVTLSILIDDEKVWTALQRSRAAYISLNYAPRSLPLRLLRNDTGNLKVWPQAMPYYVQWENEQHTTKQTVAEAPVTPGLIAGWQGNVFAKSTPKAEFWQRYQPHSTLSFSGTVLWLAKTEHEPEEWPGSVMALGKPSIMGWQLWRLEIDAAGTATTWERVEKWFSYCSIQLAQQHQHLRIISPLQATSDDNWHISLAGQPVLVQCSPPLRQLKGIAKGVYAAVETYNPDAYDRVRKLQADTRNISVPTDQISYFRWIPPRRDQYRISLEGDTAAEELLMRVVEQPVPFPSWLTGLNCTITSPHSKQSFHAHAFKGFSAPKLDAEENRVNSFTAHELPMLRWSLMPAGLPISVHWEYVSKQGSWQQESLNSIESGEILSAYWQDRIWPMLAVSTEAKLILDAGSFGSIELSFAPARVEEQSTAWWTDDRIVAQFIWLGQVHERTYGQLPMVVPASSSQKLNQLRAQVVAMPFLSKALERLAIAKRMPSWLFVRVQMLLAEIQDHNGKQE